MLSREIMGVLALGILWVNTLLIIGAAFKQASALSALKRQLTRARGRGALWRGIVRTAPLAVLRVEQVGRATTGSGPEQIEFTDAGQKAEWAGGRVERADGESFAAHDENEVDVWFDERRRAEATEAGSESSFSDAWEEARKHAGYRRTISLKIGEGESVWVWAEAKGGKLHSSSGKRIVLSTVEPIAVVARCRWRLWAFAGMAPWVAAGLTALVLTRPYFEGLSLVGGICCVVFFLLVQPAGTAVRDAARLPSAQPIAGRWRRPTDETVTA